MYAKVLLTLVYLVTSLSMAWAAGLASGNYTIGDPSSNELVISDGGTSTPLRLTNTAFRNGGVVSSFIRGNVTSHLQYHLQWYLELHPSASSPGYKVLYRGTTFVVGTTGVPGATVYTNNDASSPEFFHIELAQGGSAYQIAFDPYKVLVWTRHANSTVTLENNERSANQLWNITVSDL